MSLCFSNACGLALTTKTEMPSSSHHSSVARPLPNRRWCKPVIGGASVAVKRWHLRLAEGDLHSHWFLSVSALCLRT